MALRKPISWKPWFPALSLGFAVFIFVSTEFLPVGLLPDIADGLGQSEAATGILLTAYAWVVALMSLPLTVLSARFERRLLVLGLLAVFILAHIWAATAQSFAMLAAARICVALCHSVFWSVTPPLVARVAPEGKKTMALGIIACGVSLATVLGVPVGTILGHHYGWRAAFGIVAGVAFVVLVCLRFLLPAQPSSNAGSFRSLPELARRPALMRVYLLTLLLVSGNFTVFTYFSPFMARIGGFPPEDTAFLLLLFGGSGILGSVLGGKFADRSGIRGLAVPLAVLCALFGGLTLAGSGFAAAALLCLIWGTALSFLTFTFQVRVLSYAPDAADVAVSIHSAIFNVGIGGGALMGSLVLARGGLDLLGWVSAAFAGLALPLCLVPFRKTTQ